MGKGLRNIIIFLLPITLTLVGIYLFSKTLKPKQSPDLGRVVENEGIKIEDRTSSLLKKLSISKEHTIELHCSHVPCEDTYGAVAWSKEKDGYSLTVTALLPQLENKEFYAVFLTQNEKVLYLGTLNEEKAGYILDYVGDFSLSQYNKVIISKESHIGQSVNYSVLEATVTFE